MVHWKVAVCVAQLLSQLKSTIVILQRVPVKNSAVVSSCDGVTGSNTVQLEEPFLPLNANAGGGQSSSTSRQTQIF